MLDDVPPKFEERLEYGAFRSKPFRPTQPRRAAMETVSKRQHQTPLLT
jgi:hypothetical protein